MPKAMQYPTVVATPHALVLDSVFQAVNMASVTTSDGAVEEEEAEEEEEEAADEEDEEDEDDEDDDASTAYRSDR